MTRTSIPELQRTSNSRANEYYTHREPSLILLLGAEVLVQFICSTATSQLEESMEHSTRFLDSTNSRHGLYRCEFTGPILTH